MEDLPVGADTDDTVPAKMREAINTCLSADYKPGEPPPIPASFKIDNPRDAVKTAFEMVGGIPRLAHYADKNFDRFVHGPLSKIITAQPGASKDEPVHVLIGFDLGNRFGRLIEGVAVAEIAAQQPASEVLPTPVETVVAVQPAVAVTPKKKKKAA